MSNPMSDASTTPVDPTTDTEQEEVTDKEAMAHVDLESLGVTTELTSENLKLLVKVYNENLAVVKSYAESQKRSTTSTESLLNTVKEQFNKVPVDPAIKNINESVLDQVFSFLDEHPEQAHHMLNAFDVIREYVQDIKSSQVAEAVENLKREQGITETPDEVASEAKLICQAARGVLSLLVQMAQIMNVELPSEVPLKKGEKTGNLLLGLDNLPKGRTGASNLGKAAKARRVRYEWKHRDSETGEFVPLRQGILLSRIASEIISFKTYRVTSKELQDKFGKGKINQYSETPWELEFETGTLRGYLPSESSPSESSKEDA